MAETSKVIAKKRDRAGKGGARSSRRDGLIPAVIYGDKQPPMMIAVEPKSVEREMHREGFFNHRLQIEVDGQGFDVLPRDVQVDPVTDKPLHLDFLRIGHSIHLSSLNVPEGVRVITRDKNPTVASIAAPTVVREAAAAAAAEAAAAALAPVPAEGTAAPGAPG